MNKKKPKPKLPLTQAGQDLWNERYRGHSQPYGKYAGNPVGRVTHHGTDAEKKRYRQAVERQTRAAEEGRTAGRQTPIAKKVGGLIDKGVAAARNKAQEIREDADMLRRHPKHTLREWGLRKLEEIGEAEAEHARRRVKAQTQAATRKKKR